jgi:hypothetical protein
MRIAAAILLLIAFVLDMLAGAGCLVLGLMGADTLTGMLSSALSMVGEVGGKYSALLEAELERAVAEIMALEAKLDLVVAELMAREGRLGRLVAQLTALGGAVDYSLVAAGALIMVAGLLALSAGIWLLRGRPAKIIYVGCLAAIVADAAAFALLGFGYLQLPGFAGGLLGILAALGLHQGVDTKPAARPGANAEPVATTKPRAATRIRPTVVTAADPRPDPDAAPGPFSRVGVLISVGVIVVAGALVAYLAYDKYFANNAAVAPTQTTAPLPAPPPAPVARKEPTRTLPKPKPETVATIPSGPVEGQLAGRPFNPDRVAVKVTTPWTVAGGQTRVVGGGVKSKGFERLSLLLDAGEDFQVEIEELPASYDLAIGLDLRVTRDQKKSGQPRLTLRSPQSGSDLPKTELISDRYDLDLKLAPLRGNRLSGRISLSLPLFMKTRFAGTFKAWVDGHPDIEPDLTRGGGQTFKYIAFQYLKEIHPGSEVTIKDDTYSHQVGDASRLLRGHIMVVYSVDGEEAASMLRISTSEGYWRVVDSLDATYLAEAHPIEVPDPKNEGQWVNYLAAMHTEEWFREQHPGKYPWSVRFTGDSNTEIGYADINLRLKPYGDSDAIERRYYFLRRDGKWRYIRDLKEDEQIDGNTGKVVKVAKTS